MLVAIHQPHYLPWLRYLAKIVLADVFIILDDVQYEKNGFQNRNRIKTSRGWSYLTVPVLRPLQRPILEVEVGGGPDWREKHRRTLEASYRRAPYFHRYWPEIAALYDTEWSALAALNGAMLEVFLRQLGIGTPCVRSSEMGARGRSTERLAELCRLAGGDAYLSGAYAVEAYLEPEVLRNAGIRLCFQEWEAPVYRQLFPSAGFIADLAIVDLLFNEGPRAAEVLRRSARVIPAW